MNRENVMSFEGRIFVAFEADVRWRVGWLEEGSEGRI
jgi:hypothetical protein